MVSCKKYAAARKGEIANYLKKQSAQYTLDIFQIGDNQASNIYIKGKIADCNEVGIIPNLKHLSDTITQQQLKDMLSKSKADGVILQLPVPDHIDASKAVQMSVQPSQDVDGFLHQSQYSPCTPKGIMDWLTYNNVSLEGKNVVIIGRSKIVGRPLANMMINSHATVTVCHSKTPLPDIINYCENADIVVSAVGKPKWLSFDSHRNAIVIDVGINRDKNGNLCGDIGDVKNASYITPVPGGVGLLTRVALLDNVVSTKYTKQIIFVQN